MSDTNTYPIRKTASFVSRSVSSGKRRTYDVEAVATGNDNVAVSFNGSTMNFSSEGFGIVCNLFNELSGDIGTSDRIHKGIARKGVSGDPDFDPTDVAESDENGWNARTEGQNDEVNGVEAKIISEATSLAQADNIDTGKVAEIDAQVARNAKERNEEEAKARETDAKKTADSKDAKSTVATADTKAKSKK